MLRPIGVVREHDRDRSGSAELSGHTGYRRHLVDLADERLHGLRTVAREGVAVDDEGADGWNDRGGRRKAIAESDRRSITLDHAVDRHRPAHDLLPTERATNVN